MTLKQTFEKQQHLRSLFSMKRMVETVLSIHPTVSPSYITNIAKPDITMERYGWLLPRGKTVNYTRITIKVYLKKDLAETSLPIAD
ncbi:hypothetical protein EHS13_31975 [Paenibacillus psychroresistens]|uniref:Uncharacterized protein n=1 Tax=Paenibacillus psychroresistens TaxID=1778678 RepID=A0A6B8RTF3_9BACL|nr:hypothetical protein [Paenibacillus psychroresistens]QGQ99167.1 hypothetical protein EHS13_31975 [Paenibacillus psychroresistens]